MGVLLASVEPCGQLMEAILSYGLDQLDCCRACGSDYNLAVLSLLTLVPFLLWQFDHTCCLFHSELNYSVHPSHLAVEKPK